MTGSRQEPPSRIPSFDLGDRPPYLLADIGGTNARFAWAPCKEMEDPPPPKTLAVADYPSFGEAVAAFLGDREKKPLQLLAAVAGPVTEGRAKLTNAPWTIDTGALADPEKLPPIGLTVLNDFEAVGHALPVLTAQDVVSLRPGQGAEAALSQPGPRLAIGAGTGLGTCLAVPQAGLFPGSLPPAGAGSTAEGKRPWLVVPAEGGHQNPGSLVLADPRLAPLQTNIDQLVVESLLSGPGLGLIHETLSRDQQPPEPKGEKTPDRLTGAQIAQAAEAGEARALETVELFFDLLAEMSRDACLMTGARGGIFLAGGIVPKLLKFVDHERFEARFHSHPTLADYLLGVPLFAIVVPEPAFIGLRALAGASNR